MLGGVFTFTSWQQPGRPARPPPRASLPRREERLRGLQVRSFKALAEAIIYRLQKAACLCDMLLMMLQARKACGCSQLPGQRALLPCQIKRMQKVLLGGRRGLQRTLPPDEFAFGAQELSDPPAFLVALAPR